MLILLFYVNNQRYALACQQIVAVLPLVSLNSLPHAPEYFSGVFNYRGQVIPVLDLCQLMHNKPCSQYLSSQIILVNYCGGETVNSSIVGLMTERVVETLHKSDSQLVDANVQIGAAPYLGKIIIDEQGMIQCLRIEYLLSECEQVFLLSAS